jgi:CRP-like cAMP-binding protein
MPSRDISLSSLVRKVRRLVPLSADDEAALLGLPFRVVNARAREYLVREGAVPKECCLLVDGYAARSKLARNGGRQIVAFHVPGDILDLQHLYLERADHNVETITNATVLWLPKKDLQSIAAARTDIGTAFWRDTLIDASIFREWVLNVGRRDAKTRIAHMLCEFIVRAEAAGLGSAQHMELPFNQEDIGDATGLTSVHVNRMLRELGEDGLISRDGRVLRIEDWDRFRQVAGFDQAYLHEAA